MTASDKLQAIACQQDAASKASSALSALGRGDYEAASYWQRRSAYFADMARYFMGMR